MWREYWLTILVAILAIPLLCVVAFGFWLKRRPDMDVEKATKCWEVFIKLISALTVVASGAMLFGKYIDQQEAFEHARIEQQKQESNLKKAEFLRQKLQFDMERHQRKRILFDEVKVLAAGLANTDTPDKASISRFEEMYHGALIGVEKPSGLVEAAMFRFRKKFEKLHGAPEDDLEQLSLQLSAACEEELKESEELLIEQHEQISALLTANNIE